MYDYCQFCIKTNILVLITRRLLGTPRAYFLWRYKQNYLLVIAKIHLNIQGCVIDQEASSVRFVTIVEWIKILTSKDQYHVNISVGKQPQLCIYSLVEGGKM